MSSRSARRFAIWIALIAVMLVTVIPSITHVLSARNGRLDICTADASRRAPAGQARHALDLCSYCVLHAQLTLPPAPAVAVVPVAVRFSALPTIFLRAARTNAVWSASQPRGPPVRA